MWRITAICVVCQQYSATHTAVCQACCTYLTPLGPACYYCALPLASLAYPYCGRCIRQPPEIARALVAYRFAEPLRTLIHEYKYQNGLYLTAVLGELMLHALPQNYMTECLIPVPLHRIRLRQRGFNQAALLAQYLGKQLQWPYLTACEKVQHTEPQASLNGKQRQMNLRHAFRARPIPYQHITLVDDLLTTGSTANELAKAFKQQGVKQVDLWCCARVLQKE